MPSRSPASAQSSSAGSTTAAAPAAEAEHYRTTFPGVSWQMPEADLGHTTVELGVNGCFNAFRVLEQDVHAFEEFLEASARQINDELARRRAGRAAVERASRCGTRSGWRPSSWAGGATGCRCRCPTGRRATPGRERFRGPGLPPPDGPGVPQRLRLHRRGGRRSTTSTAPTAPSAPTSGAPTPAAARSCSAAPTSPGRIVRRGIPYGPPVRPDQPRRRRAARAARELHVRQPHRPVRGDHVRLGEPRAAGPPRHRHQRSDHRRQPARDEPVRDPDRRRRSHRPHRVPALHHHRRARSTCSAPRSPRCASSPTSESIATR